MKKFLVAGMILFMLAVITLAGNGGATRASASNTAPDKAAVDVKAPRHCITGTQRPLQCFDTEAEALRVGSGGRIQLAPGQTTASLSNSQLFSVQSTLYAILYEHANYGGATLSIYSDSCSGGNSMPAGWNDVVSSAKTGTCGITLYEHNNWSGISLHINYPGTTYVGDAMNDKASSWTLP